MQQLARTAAAGLAALGITFGLFWFMQFLISMGTDGAGDIKKGPVIEFVRLKRDSELQTRKRELPKKEKPPEPPPPPDLTMANPNAPDGDALAIAAPSVDVTPEVTGGLAFGASDSESVPIVRVQPQYPMRAAERGIEGWVLLEFTITAAGTVRDPRVIDAQPPRIFDRAAMRAIKKWKYRPRVVDGVAVERIETNRLVFELSEE